MVRPPDVYGVVVDGERGSKPNFLARDQILSDAVLDLKPIDVYQLPPGTRVCAFWSQQYRCLYPGTVSKSCLTAPSNDLAADARGDEVCA